jgi:drug/metabolite transporter (DMT)-like permease
VTRAPRALVVDALLVVMVLIWGANFSVIKLAFEEIPPQPFNALRMILATVVFLVAIRISMRQAAFGSRRVSSVFFTDHPVTRRDVRDIVVLGIIGHWFYQVGFASGVAITSVANAALIIGATPVVIALISAARGLERIGPLHWLGIGISMLGLYVIVGLGASIGVSTLSGDLLMMLSVLCWSIYTIGASRLIARHSPLFITGMTLLAGTGPYVLVTLPQLVALDWTGISAWSWWALVLSSLLALCVCYLIWYMAVQSIGPSHTAVFSNLVPIVAMVVAAVWLREPMSGTKIVGAAAVVSGVFLTRLGRRPPPVPIEE